MSSEPQVTQMNLLDINKQNYHLVNFKENKENHLSQGKPPTNINKKINKMKEYHKCIDSLNKFTQVKKMDVISVETPHIQKASDVQQADISVNIAINLGISVIYVSR